MNDQLLSQSEIAFAVGVQRATTYGWVKRGERVPKGTRPHPHGGSKTVPLYSLAAAKRLAQLYHERKAHRSKRTACAPLGNGA